MEQIQCPACKTLTTAGSKFCPRCGKVFADVPASALNISPADPPANIGAAAPAPSTSMADVPLTQPRVHFGGESTPPKPGRALFSCILFFILCGLGLAYTFMYPVQPWMRTAGYIATGVALVLLVAVYSSFSERGKVNRS